MGTRFLQKNERHAARERWRIGGAKDARDLSPQTPRQLNGNPSPAGLSGKRATEGFVSTSPSRKKGSKQASKEQATAPHLTEWDRIAASGLHVPSTHPISRWSESNQHAFRCTPLCPAQMAARRVQMKAPLQVGLMTTQSAATAPGCAPSFPARNQEWRS